MPENRFFLSEEMQEGTIVSLAGEEAHHMRIVMRKKAGETLELIDGRGALAQAEIIGFSKDAVQLEIKSLFREKKSAFEVVLAQAIPRINRLDAILEKGTELGMTKLWLFPGMHSEKKSISPSQFQRMQKILISATKQCGRLFLPEIELKPSLDNWKGLNLPSFFGDIDSSAPAFFPILQSEKPPKGVLFFIGPEQGFHSQEETILKELGARGVKLHPNILRTDTASLCALSLISQL